MTKDDIFFDRPYLVKKYNTYFKDVMEVPKGISPYLEYNFDECKDIYSSIDRQLLEIKISEKAQSNKANNSEQSANKKNVEQFTSNLELDKTLLDDQKKRTAKYRENELKKYKEEQGKKIGL